MSDFDYEAYYGTPIQPGSATVEDKPAMKSGKSTGQRSNKKHAALEKFRALHNFCVAGMPEVSSTAGRVWVILLDWSTDGVVSMSHKQIAKQLGSRGKFAERTAGRAIAELEGAGYLTVLVRGGKNIGPSNYQLHAAPIQSEAA